MFGNSRWLAGGLLATTLLFSACKEPKDLGVSGGVFGEPWIINWNNTSAMGLYVTSGDTKVPTGPGQKIKSGTVYWVLEATGFPSGFENPVTYGVVPEGAKEVTEEHGGAPGAAVLACGVEYKVSVVSLGGPAETFTSWDCPEQVVN